MRVLLVSHEASRTGAPRIAVLVARALVSQGHDVAVLSRAPGPLLADLAAVAPTSVEPLHRVRRRLWRTPVLRRAAWLVDTVLATASLLRRRPDLVYVNSVAAGIYLRPARWLRLRVVLHAHESGAVAAPFLRRDHTPAGRREIALVACSPSVRRDLSLALNRPLATITMLPSVPDDARARQLAAQAPDRSYTAGQLVVGCCGSVEHRKGADLWIQVAERVRATVPELDVRFVWLGDLPSQPMPGTAAAGAEFLGPTPNPYAHMARFDVATLPSRDDPFPLVVLEAMLLGTPVVAFDVGGVSEQVGDAGIVVPAGDIDAFADAVVGLLTDPVGRARFGDAARRRVDTLYSTSAFAAGLATLVSSAAEALAVTELDG